MRAWSTTSRSPRIAGPGRVVGAKRRLADRQRPLILFSCPFQTRQAVGWTLLNRRPDTHSDTRPDSRPRWTPWLGLLDGTSGHQGGRPPRPTAWPDAFLWSSAVVHPCGLAEEYEMTNDSVPHTVGRGGDRPLGCPPLRGPAGCSSRCPAVQDGSVHPDRQCGWAVGDQAERPCSANPSPQARGACLPENRASNTSPPRSGPRRSVTVWRPATWPPQGLGDAAVHRQALQVQAVQAIVRRPMSGGGTGSATPKAIHSSRRRRRVVAEQLWSAMRRSRRSRPKIWMSLSEDDAVGDALAVAAERVVDLAGGQQRGELVPEGFLDAGWDRRHQTSA